MSSANSWERVLSIAAIGLLVLGAAGVGAGAAAHGWARAGTLRGAALSHSSTVSSTNWAGYAVTTSSSSVTAVYGSWKEPKIQGSCPSTDQYAAFWVGIDGYSSSTVEQIGTDSDCQGGSPTYYAWYEFYPNPSHLISSITVHPGDVLSASVKYVKGHFTVSITDVTHSKSFSKNGTLTASRDSAEWIAEAPSSSSSILPLADFGTVGCGNATTGVNTTDEATIGGTTAPIGSFSSVVEISMVNNAGTAYKAVPGSLGSGGKSFSVVWKSAGP